MKLFRLFVVFFFLCLSPSFASEIQDAYDFYMNGEYKKAINIIDRAENFGIKNAQLSFLKFLIYEKTNNLSLAKQALLDAINYDSECYEAYIGLVALAVDEMDAISAKKYFDIAIKINPKIMEMPNALYFYAQICILNKDFDLALKTILSAIEISPGEKRYYLELGKIYLYQNKFLYAINAFEYALGDNLELDAECYNYLGVANSKRGNYGIALENFKKAVQISPGITYLSNLALLYKKTSDKTNYEKTVLLIKSKTPTSAQDFLQKSQTMYAGGDSELAKKILEEGLKKYPDNPALKEAFNHLNKL